jgi:hypothetical protein
MTLPFIVQGGPPYTGLVERERERERESEFFLASLVGIVSSISRDHQLRQSESLCGHWPSPVSRSGRLVMSLYIVLFRSGCGRVLISTV